MFYIAQVIVHCQYFHVDCTVVRLLQVTSAFTWIALFGGGYCKAASPKRLVGGTPLRAADTWRLGCQAWVLGKPRTPARAPSSNHLVQGLSSLRRQGQTRAPGFSPKESGCAAPRAWGLQPRALDQQTHELGVDPAAKVCSHNPWV